MNHYKQIPRYICTFGKENNRMCLTHARMLLFRTPRSRVKSQTRYNPPPESEKQILLLNMSKIIIFQLMAKNQ